MKIAVNINGQFGPMTGVQHYVDSLLKSLYASSTCHQIVAFAPVVHSTDLWDYGVREGTFDWRTASRAYVSTSGNDFALSNHQMFHRRGRLWRLAGKIDRRLISRVKSRTQGWRERSTSRRFDLLHTPSPSGPDYRKYCAKHNTVTIYDLTTITQAQTHDSGNVRLWQELFDYARTYCSRVLTISEWTKQDIVRYLSIPEDRIDVTPLAARVSTFRIIDEAEIHRCLKRLHLADRPFVLYAGTLEPRKNLKRLIHAFALASKEGRLWDHALVLAGGAWGQHEAELRAYAEGLGIADRLLTTGYVSNPDLNVLMSSCEVFVYVSEYEGFGLPPLEAMVCGAPVVASNTTSIPEVVGDAGLQVSPADVDEIAGALHLLLTSREENMRRRALSLERAKLFSWERTAALTLKSYEAAVS